MAKTSFRRAAGDFKDAAINNMIMIAVSPLMIAGLITWIAKESFQDALEHPKTQNLQRRYKWLGRLRRHDYEPL